MSDLDRAIDDAAACLAGARGPDHLWRDFRTLAGESCDWVSAYIAYSIGSSGLLRDIVRETGVALHYRQRQSGGWSYNEIVPPDCDSTAWVMMALSTTTAWRPSTIIRAASYVLRHASQRGFATYAAEDGIDRFIAADAELTTGWRSPHLCVTAVALQALLLHGVRREEPRIREAIDWLRESQGQDGLWRSYWWKGPAYATFHALRALVAARALSTAIWECARDGLLHAQNVDGGWGDDDASHAFATAQAMQALVTRPDPICDEALRNAVSFLIASQENGMWSVVPILRIPPPMAPEPLADEWREDELGTGVVIRDERSVFTSAAALAALGAYRTWSAAALHS